MRRGSGIPARLAALMLAAAFALLSAAAAAGESAGYRVAPGNEENFRKLFGLLKSAYETPAPGDGEAIDRRLERIRAVNADDYDIALAVAEHWKQVYLDRRYRIFLYRGEETAVTLERSDPPIGDRHAIVVLGYQLDNGEMREELKGRCRAAAAMARSWPDAILVCSGGATGANNPEGHTEAGLMKDFLVTECGIDASRIYTDEKAMTTLENAVNTFQILRSRRIHTITLVTSDYHQRWGQVLYNAMAAVCKKKDGWSVKIVGNYCYPIEPAQESYRNDAGIALTQLASMLGIPRR